MGLFSWFNTSETKSTEGLDNDIPQKTQCYHIVRSFNDFTSDLSINNFLFLLGRVLDLFLFYQCCNYW